MRFAISVFVLGIVLLVSCGLDELLDPSMKCNLSDVGICIDFAATLDNAQASAACAVYKTDMNSTIDPTVAFDALGACSTTGLVGSCAVDNGTIRYKIPSWTDGTAQTACTALSGTYTSATR